MNEFEKVEKLRTKADVSYEEAKRALEENNWDLLDAMIALEKEGKAKQPTRQSYSTKYEKGHDDKETKGEYYYEYYGSESLWTKVKSACKKIVVNGMENQFVIKRNGDTILKLPVLIFVILLLALWEVALPLLIIGLFLSCRYEFVGIEEMEPVNKAMDAMENMAEDIKDEFKKN